MQNAQPHSQRAIRLPELKNQTGLSRSTIYDKLNPKSPRYDSTFPLPKKLGSRAIGWIEAEVQAWIESRRVMGA
jgi:prophage regulatory protein